MTIMKNFLFSILALSLTCTVSAQDMNLNNSTKPVRKDTATKPFDGHYRNTDIENRKVVDYPTLRQVDVAYRKRIWREIDVREKMNIVFASPNARLMDIIIKAIEEGKLTAYDPTPTEKNPTGDNFEYMEELPVAQVMARLGGDSVLVEEFNENNEVISSHYENRAFSGENVLKFRIKEDWIFDKQRCVFEPRIIGIAPLITPTIPGMDVALVSNSIPTTSSTDPFDPFAPKESSTGLESSTEAIAPPINQEVSTFSQVDPTPAFWIYFPEARHVFVNKEVMGRNNAATGLTYDDVFIKRIFTSYIVKQDNPEDLRIKDYIQDDIERLYESERIKKVIMDWEQNLWSY